MIGLMRKGATRRIITTPINAASSHKENAIALHFMVLLRL